jgi:hypothetical protein
MPKQIKSPKEKKKPSDYNYQRISLMVSPELKHEWDHYAASQNQTLSSVIREAMRLLMKMNQVENSSFENLDHKIDDMRSSLEEKLAFYSAQFNTLPKQAEIEEVNKDQLKIKILDALDHNPQGLKPKILASKCNVDDGKLFQILSELQSYGLVQTKKGLIIKE